jgi:signal transduction histidine kinase/DNA-binding response OmpR family regulator
MALLKDLAARQNAARTSREACVSAMETLAARPQDISFALAYIDDRLQSCTPDADTRLAATTTQLTRELAIVPPGGDGPAGRLVVGLNPQRPFDDQYRAFLELVAGQLGNAIANARAYEAERERAEALARIDRAKTAFFSNISHEFRTPLTLMLGPTEQALAADDRALRGGELAMVHRNQLRLLKLVNALLDFSRIEAGRARATYRPTDLAAVTRDLAGAFRSTIEHAGVRFDVDCPSGAAPVYVDRDMWEKVVMNLLSNAFKFTFDGAIRVVLRPAGAFVELAIADTGTGIPDHEVPRVFDRFHRVEGARSRTYEGSGIGLALTAELVRLHGGTIEVASRVGVGSTFTVRIPTGRAHLPPDRVDDSPAAPPFLLSAAFVHEASRWLDDSGAASAAAVTADPSIAPAAGRRERILIADDNADMRDYLRELLGDWEVETAAHGAAALERARTAPPDLIVSDVMMPELDGLGLLAALRADPRTAAIPVLMLSARSGEDARVSGLAAGADDYVIKPFSARELTARVRSLLALAEARRDAALQKDHLHALFMQAPTPIMILEGPQHVVELANAAACRLWGRDERDILHRPLPETLPLLEGTRLRGLLDDVLRTGVAKVGKEIKGRLDRRGDGSLDAAWFNFVCAPKRTVRDDVDGVLVIAFDVTDEVRARDEINALRIAEASANRTKDEFLAMLGHELRNPLAPILTALQLMTLRGDAGAERERTVIDRQVRHLVRLVDDLLDVSRITRGRIDLQRRPVELSDVVASAIEAASPLLEERQHHLELHVPRRGLLVNGDTTRLTQVVANLVTNAAKYTEPRGRITVAARRTGDRVELQVRDTGIGIAPELLAQVFEMFAQDRQSLERSRGGLGLGLTIARSLVSLHDGTIEARSRGRGTGSEFIVTLPALAGPMASGDAAPAGQGAPVTGSGRRRVLVVDDNSDAARLIATALEAVGHDTRVAFDGPGAVARAAAFDPDAVLLDLGLPLMDGFEVARQLRSQEADGHAPVLIAVTGYGQKSDVVRTELAGFHAHLVKPVDVHELVSLLDRLLRVP